MDSGLPLLAALSTVSCAVLAIAVGLRRERSVAASIVLALISALALWSGGLGVAQTFGPGPVAVAANRIAALGAFGATGLWLLLALRQRWPRRLGGVVPALVALMPAGVFLAAAVSRPDPGLVFRYDSSFPGQAWAGPFTHLLFALAFACATAGAALFSHAAMRLWREGERRPGLTLALVMLAQPVVFFADLHGATGSSYPLAAGSLTVAMLVLSTTLLRHSLLHAPPIGHRQVIDRLRHGVLMASSSGEILDHNAAAERLLGGLPRGRSIADAIAAIAPTAQREPIRDAIERVDVEAVSLQVEADRRRHLEVSVRPIAGDRGSVIGQIAVLRDRTAERSYAEAALRTEKLEAVGTLAAGVAHEVNNPLAFVRANLGEITRLSELTHAWRAKQESPLADALEELGELAQDALAGLTRIQRAVSDVRRLAAAPDSGATAVSIEATVLDALRLLELRGSGRIEIRNHFAPALPAVLGSAQLLVQAVLSLLLNAQQALEGTPEPWIEVEIGGGDLAVCVCVRDNGPPLPAALRERVHEPYQLAARDPYGRGLGTSLAAGIARDHGGSLSAEPCEGGAVFVLSLPARSEP